MMNASPPPAEPTPEMGMATYLQEGAIIAFACWASVGTARAYSAVVLAGRYAHRERFDSFAATGKWVRDRLAYRKIDMEQAGVVIEVTIQA